MASLEHILSMALEGDAAEMKKVLDLFPVLNELTSWLRRHDGEPAMCDGLEVKCGVRPGSAAKVVEHLIEHKHIQAPDVVLSPVTISVVTTMQQTKPLSITFQSNERFELWLTRKNAGELQLIDDQGLPSDEATTRFDELQPLGTYLLGQPEPTQQMRDLQTAANHRIDGEEHELGLAMQTWYEEGSKSTSVEVRDQWRILRDATGPMEFDAVVEADDEIGFGELKLHIGGVGDIQQLEGKVARVEADMPPELPAKRIRKFFMANNIEHDHLKPVTQYCKRRGVVLMGRNGNNISAALQQAKPPPHSRLARTFVGVW